MRKSIVLPSEVHFAFHLEIKIEGYCSSIGFHLKLVASQLNDWKMSSVWLKQRTSETGHRLESLGAFVHLLPNVCLATISQLAYSRQYCAH